MKKSLCLLRCLCALLIVSASSLLSSCASVTAPDERDPWEALNRSIYVFNDDFDRSIGRPVAETYKEYTPDTVKTGISNFFSNIDDIMVFFNDLLQFKFHQAVEDFARVTFNTTFGIFGLIDVASGMDLQKHDEDFGQTLASWGVGDGAYLMLPFLGPSTVRDTGGIFVDSYIDPLYDIKNNDSRWGMIVLRAIDKRASLLEATKIMEKSGIDPYVFLRNAYFQLREHQIYDGNPPRPKIEAPTKSDLKLEEELEKELQLDSPGK